MELELIRWFDVIFAKTLIKISFEKNYLLFLTKYFLFYFNLEIPCTNHYIKCSFLAERFSFRNFQLVSCSLALKIADRRLFESKSFRFSCFDHFIIFSTTVLFLFLFKECAGISVWDTARRLDTAQAKEVQPKLCPKRSLARRACVQT